MAREDKARLRNALIPVSRRCPHCKKLIYRSRQWIIHKKFCGCRSCWMLQGKPSGEPYTVKEVCKKKFNKVCRTCAKLIRDWKEWDKDFECCKKCVAKMLGKLYDRDR